MVRSTISRASYALCTAPHFTLALAALLTKSTQIKKDLEKCISAIKSLEHKAKNISPELIQTLILAEDHRNNLHFGIDQFGILRAITVKIRTGERQGASTIEQQFVRTVTGRYERTLRRKVREQLTAILLRSCSNRQAIARSYLAIAHYGTGLNGHSDLLVSKATQGSAEIISYLKYPLATTDDKDKNIIKRARRIQHIKNLSAQHYLNERLTVLPTPGRPESRNTTPQ